MKSLRDVITCIGARKIASALNLTPKAVYKWRDANVLPRTEYTGETHYAQTLAQMVGNQVSVEEILAFSRPTING